jgi:hypothetical protein
VAIAVCAILRSLRSISWRFFNPETRLKLSSQELNLEDFEMGPKSMLVELRFHKEIIILVEIPLIWALHEIITFAVFVQNALIDVAVLV